MTDAQLQEVEKVVKTLMSGNEDYPGIIDLNRKLMEIRDAINETNKLLKKLLNR
jgi:Mg2+ and Co2+ transporter CorA